MSHPPFTAAEERTRAAFLALMWALSYPGRVQQLPEHAQAFALIAETLLDLETSYYSHDESLNPMLKQTGAALLPVTDAAYLFFPVLASSDLPLIRQANMGTMLFPDESASLFIGCTLGGGDTFVLQGPGIKGQQAIQVNGIPRAFWEMRETACRFPLGWDVYLVDGQQVIGLPRSIRVDVI
ncbi:MAG: phosphonate C-P lyase system protein PhnH [Anaerolineae bacterium]